MHDDWYRASTPHGILNATRNSSGKTNPSYHSDEAASPLGCLSQIQYCIIGSSGERKCGPLSSEEDSFAQAALTFGFVDEDLSPIRTSSSSAKGSRFFWTTNILDYSAGLTLYDIVNHLGPRSLASQTGLTQGIQGPLPVDQWKHDVTRWYNASKAATQAAFINTAHGPFESGLGNCTRCVSPPLNAYEESMCQNQVRPSHFVYPTRVLTREQKILSTAYASFSLLGLYLTLLIGIATVFLSYSLEPFFEYLHKHRKYDQYRFLEWTSHSVLQLQRQGHESLGLGTWEKCIETVPVSKPDEIMGFLDITDATHPLLRRPSFDEVAPGAKADEPSQTTLSVNCDEPTNGQAAGEGNEETCTDQAARPDDTYQAARDASSPDNNTAASTIQIFFSENGTTAPEYHKDQSSLPAADTTSGNAPN